MYLNVNSGNNWKAFIINVIIINNGNYFKFFVINFFMINIYSVFHMLDIFILY